MEPTFRKISIRVWTPLLEKFSARIDSACLRRDAFLAKLLEHEVEALEAEIGLANSAAAQRFIAAHLDALPRKLVTLTLPEELVRRLDDLCERRNIVRDSFFNRLFFLLVADFRHLTRLFFDGDDAWFPQLLEKTDFSSSAAGALLDPIPGFRDPFLTIRMGRHMLRDRLIEEFGTAERADERLAASGIYRTTITDRTFGALDLFGLNVYLPDERIPGAAANARVEMSLDDLLDAGALTAGPQP